MRRQRWVLRKEFFGGILYDKERKEYFYVDEETVATLQQISHRCGKIDLPQGYIDFLAGGGIIDLNNKQEALFVGEVVDHPRRPDDFLVAPLRIHLAITYRCPLNCAHCFIKGYENTDRKANPEMETGEIRRLVDRLVEIGIYEMLVSGGEPLVRQDISECLSYALDKGMLVKLFTNGLLLDGRRIQQLQGLKLGYIAIGFDGPDPVSYGLIRKQSVFDAVLKNIQLARKKLDVPVAIQFTCTKRNTDPQTLTRLVEFSIENSVSLRVRPVNPCGNTLYNPDLLLDYNEYLRILQTLHELFLQKGCSPAEMKAKQGNIRLKFSRRTIKFDTAPLPYLGWGCPGGYVHAFIDAYGNMHPCGFLVNHLPRDDNDNVREKDPQDIWLHGKGFIHKRSLSGNDVCWGCKYFITCRGGCRTRALYWKNDINAADRYCRRALEDGCGAKGFIC